MQDELFKATLQIASCLFKWLSSPAKILSSPIRIYDYIQLLFDAVVSSLAKDRVKKLGDFPRCNEWMIDDVTAHFHIGARGQPYRHWLVRPPILSQLNQPLIKRE